MKKITLVDGRKIIFPPDHKFAVILNSYYLNNINDKFAFSEEFGRPNEKSYTTYRTEIEAAHKSDCLTARRWTHYIINKNKERFIVDPTKLLPNFLISYIY